MATQSAASHFVFASLVGNLLAIFHNMQQSQVFLEACCYFFSRSVLRDFSSTEAVYAWMDPGEGGALCRSYA